MGQTAGQAVASGSGLYEMMHDGPGTKDPCRVRRGALSVVCVLAASTVACSTTVAGEPGPVTTSSGFIPQGDNYRLPNFGVPNVEQPVSESAMQRVLADTCSTLTDIQAGDLGVGFPGDPKPASTGPACFWKNAESGSFAGVLFPNRIIYRGLSQYYKDREGKYEERGYFAELKSIRGFPAIASEPVDSRDAGTCAVQVGLTDREVVQIGVGLSDAKVGQSDPCSAAQQVADMVVGNIVGSS